MCVAYIPGLFVSASLCLLGRVPSVRDLAGLFSLLFVPLGVRFFSFRGLERLASQDAVDSFPHNEGPGGADREQDNGDGNPAEAQSHVVGLDRDKGPK